MPDSLATLLFGREALQGVQRSADPSAVIGCGEQGQVAR